MAVAKLRVQIIVKLIGARTKEDDKMIPVCHGLAWILVVSWEGLKLNGS